MCCRQDADSTSGAPTNLGVLAVQLFTYPPLMKLVVLFVALVFSLSGDEPDPDPNELPRIPFTVAMCFDEFGRLFVVEMIGCSERQHEKLGRVRRLVDTNGDGRFDKSTIFAKGLAWPTTVFCANGLKSCSTPLPF